MSEHNKRDYLGDQIGWAVRQQLFPIQELRQLDKKIIKALPKPLASFIIMIKSSLNCLPLIEDPTGLYNEFVNILGQQYLDQYGKSQNITSLIMPSTNGTQVVSLSQETESSNYPRSWNQQVKWAQSIFERNQQGQPQTNTDLREAVLISFLDEKIKQMGEKLKPVFVDRGLPLPLLYDQD